MVVIGIIVGIIITIKSSPDDTLEASLGHHRTLHASIHGVGRLRRPVVIFAHESGASGMWKGSIGRWRRWLGPLPVALPEPAFVHEDRIFASSDRVFPFGYGKFACGDSTFPGEESGVVSVRIGKAKWIRSRGSR